MNCTYYVYEHGTKVKRDGIVKTVRIKNTKKKHCKDGQLKVAKSNVSKHSTAN